MIFQNLQISIDCLSNLKSYCSGELFTGITTFTVKDNSLCFFKTTVNPSERVAYIDVTKITKKKFVTLLAVIPDSSSQNLQYVFTGDSTDSHPLSTDENGFWVYYNATSPAWISVICVVRN